MDMPRTILVVLAGLSLAGCETLYQSGYRQPPAESDARREALRVEMARQQAARDLETLKAESEAASRNLQRLDARLERLEADTRQNAATRAELETLRRDVEQLRGEREQLRKQIVDELSREMARLLAAQPAATGRASGASSQGTAATRGQSGWEHKVLAGQTLSEIAAAYKVSVAGIMKANDMKSDLIRVGQVLFIPD